MAPNRSYPPRPEAVYFFGTCLIESVYPQAGMAAIRVLQREGLRVIFPREYPVVVPSGSCAGMMRHHYPYLFAGQPEGEQTRRFADRVFEFTEFMHHVLGATFADKGPPLRVTWHSSCHAMREMQITEDSKRLLRQLDQVELVELEREEECCGFGGTFSVKQPAISSAMVYDKTEDIRQTGAERVISGDCGCLMNISGTLEHRRIPVQSQHIAEFIWERIHA